METFLSAPALQKVVSCIHFCQIGLSGCQLSFTGHCRFRILTHGLLYPIYELHHCGPVSYMGLFRAADFCFVFYCLHKFCRVGAIYDFDGVRKTPCHSIAYPFLTEKKLSRRKFFKVVENPKIRQNLRCLRQGCGGLSFRIIYKTFVQHIQLLFFPADYGKGIEHRGVFHIISPQVI